MKFLVLVLLIALVFTYDEEFCASNPKNRCCLQKMKCCTSNGDCNISVGGVSLDLRCDVTNKICYKNGLTINRGGKTLFNGCTSPNLAYIGKLNNADVCGYITK